VPDEPLSIWVVHAGTEHMCTVGGLFRTLEGALRYVEADSGGAVKLHRMGSTHDNEWYAGKGRVFDQYRDYVVTRKAVSDE
jgi:hypothetical protein